MDPARFCSFSMLGTHVNWPVMAQIPYMSFSPKAKDTEGLYRTVMGSTVKNCNYVITPILGPFSRGTESEIIAILASIATPMMPPVEILVSTMKINAIGTLENPSDKLNQK